MKFKQVAVLAATVLFATAAFSGDKVHQKMEVKVVSADGTDEPVVVLDSESLGFDMYEMQVGENRSVIDKNGRAVLLSRNEDGFSLDVDGKTIDLPPMRGHLRDRAWVHGARDLDTDVHFIKGHADGGPTDVDGVLIFSSKEIDAATQDLIRATLKAAGHSDVRFAGSDDGGPHQVHVIRKFDAAREISE